MGLNIHNRIMDAFMECTMDLIAHLTVMLSARFLLSKTTVAVRTSDVPRP